jgi:post-segregation antitoxin (ccd killing protein)
MITLDLPADIEARLAAEAQARGLDVAEYAAGVLAAAVSTSNTDTAVDENARPAAVEETSAWLDQLAQFSHKIPAMPGETFSREMIYPDDN